MFCKFCGTQMPDHASFCPSCGAQTGRLKATPKEAATPQMAPRAVAKTTSKTISKAGGATSKPASKTAWRKILLVFVAVLAVALLAGGGMLAVRSLSGIEDTVQDAGKDEGKNIDEGGLAAGDSAADESKTDGQGESGQSESAELTDEQARETLLELLEELPLNVEEWSDMQLADFFLVQAGLRQVRAEHSLFPIRVEQGEAVPPVTVDGISPSSGEEVSYIRCLTKEMEDFIQDIYGRDVGIPDGKLLYEEFRNKDGYLWEWGNGWKMSVETGDPLQRETPRIISDEGETLEIAMDYSEADLYGDIYLQGCVTTVWKRNSESFVGYTLAEERDEILWEKDDFSMTAEEVEQERLRIKDAIAAGSMDIVKVPAGTDGNPWTRNYYYEDGRLAFVFFTQSVNGDPDQRFYFKDDRMIRWIIGTSPDQIYYNISDDELPQEWQEHERECLEFEP